VYSGDGVTVGDVDECGQNGMVLMHKNVEWIGIW
jgi:hypothetical protein